MARSSSAKRHLGGASRRRRLEDDVGIQTYGRDLETAAVVCLRLRPEGRVARSRDQLEEDAAVLAVDLNPPFLREVNRGLVSLRRVAHKDIAPSASWNDVLDVDDVVRKLLEEHPRLDLRFSLLLHQAQRDFTKRLIGVGQGDDDLVRRRRGSDESNQEHRAGQAQQADAARLHRHKLAVRRQTREAHQDSQEHGDRNRQAQRLRQERHEDAKDDRPGHAF